METPPATSLLDDDRPLSPADASRRSSFLHRRTFLQRCGLLAAGSVLAASLTVPDGLIRAAGASAQSSRQMTPGDRALLGVLSAYSADSYFWGSQVFARATGLRAADTTNLLVRVGDYSRLVSFLRSNSVKTLGKIIVANDTLSFTYQGAAYTVTNKGTEDFNRAVADGGVTRDHLPGVGVFAHQAMLYHPATDTLRDPYLAASNKRLDLVKMPAGGTPARMQTLLQGWLEARRQKLEFGPTFVSFQQKLLDGQPTAKAASEIVTALLDHLSELAVVYDLDELSTLLLSPLISDSLRVALGVDANQVVADAKALRAEFALASYSDAAIWLATLLPTQIEAGTVDEWLASPDADAAATAATQAALPLAKKLAKTLAAGTL